MAAGVLSTHARHVDKALLLELVPLLKDKDPIMRQAIIRALTYDVAKLPRVKTAMEQALQDTNEDVRWMASWALLRADKNHAASLATLKGLFSSTNAMTRFQAASHYLRSDREKPRAEDELLPIFLSSLTSTNFLLYGGASDALPKFGSRARAAVPGLQLLLTNQSLTIRESATNALLEIAPEVLKPPKP